MDWFRPFSRVGHDLRLRAVVHEYAAKNAYEVSHVVEPSCGGCNGRRFHVLIDDYAGAATRRCSACNSTHPIGDSGDFLDDAELEECACPCGSEEFTIAV